MKASEIQISLRKLLVLKSDGGSPALATEIRHQTALLQARVFSPEHDTGIYVSRVASEENVSDEPSRERYQLLKRIKATFAEPKLSWRFRDPQCWEALSVVAWEKVKRSRPS